uniref:Leucine zipper like post translational regulator 1 n=2 Tax=Canis lupus familiaris TaxID=9615 RepID=A0A8I3Q1E7_CANLF
MGTCRHLLGPGLGWESGKMALRGRWCLKFKEEKPGGRMTHVAGTAPVEPSVRRVWRELGSSPRPGPHAARRGWGVLQVVTVDVRNKKVVFKDGFKLEYSKLLLAPGSSPKTLSCKGKEVENVFTIRTPEDANRVVRLARGRNAVVVGAGFLGMEVAAYLTEKAHSVSVVELEETPFRRFLGERVGRALMKMFENNRVKFYMQTEVSELRAQEGKVGPASCPPLSGSGAGELGLPPHPPLPTAEGGRAEEQQGCAGRRLCGGHWRGARHGLPEAEQHQSGFPRLHPCQQDDADQRPRRVCSRRCCHFPPGLEEQSESEHPTLADGSCPGAGGGPEHAGAGGGDQHRALPVDCHVRQEPALRGVRRRL